MEGTTRIYCFNPEYWKTQRVFYSWWKDQHEMVKNIDTLTGLTSTKITLSRVMTECQNLESTLLCQKKYSCRLYPQSSSTCKLHTKFEFLIQHLFPTSKTISNYDNFLISNWNINLKSIYQYSAFCLYNCKLLPTKLQESSQRY